MSIKSIKILIVDDDPDDTFVTARYIKQGFQDTALAIEQAASFTEIESHLESTQFDLFLIDYHLGEITGLEVMRKIRQQGIKKPLILLTGQGDETVAVAAMKEGASDYLQKDALSPTILRNSIRYSMELYQTEVRRHKTEKALKRSEEKYRTIINTTAEGYCLLNPDLKMVDLNTSLCRMLKYSREEILSTPPATLIEEGKRIAFKGALNSILSSNQKVFETVLTTKYGEPVYAILNASTIRNRKGKLLWLVVFVTDVSPLKEAEETLKKANDDLKKVNLMKSEFVSYASHELRTPLTSIKNAISILVKEKAGPCNDTQAHFLKIAARNIDRLSELINDVLDLSKLEAGKLEFRSSELRLTDVVQNISTLFQAQASERKIQFKSDAMQNLPPVYADADRVEQVLCNLLSNALKFTPEGGRVCISSEKADDWVTISISDTGPGLSEEDQARVFDRFYQGSNGLGQTMKGTGLGLSISKELVELQGGKISVESRSGGGCRFFFTLPVFSQCAIEMVALEKEICRYPKDSIFSLIRVELHTEEAVHEGISDSEIPDKVLDIVRKALQRASDVMIYQPAFGRILCLLPGTSKTNAMRVKERLDLFLSPETRGVEGLQSPVSAIIGPVTYPEEGRTGKELIISAECIVTKDGRRSEHEKNSHCRQ